MQCVVGIKFTNLIDEPSKNLWKKEKAFLYVRLYVGITHLFQVSNFMK